jgi:HK97 family phage portal protein
MELDVSLSGNAYVYKSGPNRLQVLHPNKVEVSTDTGRQVDGYLYWPDGIGSGRPTPIVTRDMAHWAPIPHPERAFLGVAWIEAVLPEIRSAMKMVGHQEAYYNNAATPNLFVQVESRMTDDARTRLRAELERRYAGVENAWKTLVLDGGADLKVVGQDFQQMDFVNTSTAVEARIASAAGVPPIIVGLKAGLDAATYSNYNMAMRAFADHTIRPLWNSAVAALAQIVPSPVGAELWYDDSGVAALRQDQTEEATIRQTNANTLRSLIDGGFTPESAVMAVMASDFSLLEHTGMLSVQLQEPGTETATSNGSGDINELEEVTT